MPQFGDDQNAVHGPGPSGVVPKWSLDFAMLEARYGAIGVEARIR